VLKMNLDLRLMHRDFRYSSLSGDFYVRVCVCVCVWSAGCQTQRDLLKAQGAEVRLWALQTAARDQHRIVTHIIDRQLRNSLLAQHRKCLVTITVHKLQFEAEERQRTHNLMSSYYCPSIPETLKTFSFVYAR